MEDIVQIRKCLSGQKDAFEYLVTKYKNLVYSIALNSLINKNEAADVTQEVFLKAWANLSRYNPEFSFKTWIARITVNHCINLNQKSKRITTWDDEEMEKIVADSESPEEATLDGERRKDIIDAINSLPEKYRIVIQLYHQQSLSYEEICNITSNPMSIVKNRIYRARKMLAEKLSKYSQKALKKGEESWIADKHGT
ncbi:MAG: sigma-70 family RNA polymerase sigma factor [Clostridiaceae bacterium]|jgi:RNA polymerase sigma-70 factor (ECF subfamily)|nr:sigma-70 family RNA polymerase sigma factor [Clostridiaceae bacterium]